MTPSPSAICQPADSCCRRSRSATARSCRSCPRARRSPARRPARRPQQRQLIGDDPDLAQHRVAHSESTGVAIRSRRKSSSCGTPDAVTRRILPLPAGEQQARRHRQQRHRRRVQVGRLQPVARGRLGGGQVRAGLVVRQDPDDLGVLRPQTRQGVQLRPAVVTAGVRDVEDHVGGTGRRRPADPGRAGGVHEGRPRQHPRRHPVQGAGQGHCPSRLPHSRRRTVAARPTTTGRPRAAPPGRPDPPGRRAGRPVRAGG